jgi:hypothetical protein
MCFEQQISDDFSVVGRLLGAEILKLGWFGYVSTFPSLSSESVLADSIVR